MAQNVPGSGQILPVQPFMGEICTETPERPSLGVCMQKALMSSVKMCDLAHVGPGERTQEGADRESLHQQPSDDMAF